MIDGLVDGIVLGQGWSAIENSQLGGLLFYLKNFLTLFTFFQVLSISIAKNYVKSNQIINRLPTINPSPSILKSPNKTHQCSAHL